jgi:hypothetical protein
MANRYEDAAATNKALVAGARGVLAKTASA